MKKIIIIVGEIILGVFIFMLILGNDTTTLKGSTKQLMENQILNYKTNP